jgi:hypothetical protein
MAIHASQPYVRRLLKKVDGRTHDTTTLRHRKKRCGLQPPLDGLFTFPREINDTVFPNAKNVKQLRKSYSIFAQYIYLSMYKLHNGQMSGHGWARPAEPCHSGATWIMVHGLTPDCGPNEAGSRIRFSFFFSFFRSLFKKVWGRKRMVYDRTTSRDLCHTHYFESHGLQEKYRTKKERDVYVVTTTPPRCCREGCEQPMEGPSMIEILKPDGSGPEDLHLILRHVSIIPGPQ